MARAQAPTLSPQMFRHFAVITVVITGLLAMFADGESREVIRAQAQAAAQKSSKPAERTDLGGGNRTLIKGSPDQSRGWGPDEGAPSAPRRTGRRRSNAWGASPNGRAEFHPPMAAVSQSEVARMTSGEATGPHKFVKPIRDPSDLPRTTPQSGYGAAQKLPKSRDSYQPDFDPEE